MLPSEENERPSHDEPAGVDGAASPSPPLSVDAATSLLAFFGTSGQDSSVIVGDSGAAAGAAAAAAASDDDDDEAWASAFTLVAPVLKDSMEEEPAY